MGIDAVDTVKSTFGSLNTTTGYKVIGLLFVAQLVNMLGSMAYQSGSAAALLGLLTTVISVAAAAVIAVGALRSFDQDSFEKSHYTQNLFWPILRSAGANTTSSVFAYGLGILAAAPVVVATRLLGVGVTPGSTIGMALNLASITIGAAVFVYLVLTMILSAPMIATSDKRMFQALDQSIRRTKGYRKSMALALLPVAAIYLAIVAGLTALAPSSGTSPLFGAVSVLLSSVMSAALLSLLTEYDQRLPEV